MERFSEEELQEFAETFQMFDENGDGTISAKELGRGLQACGQNPTRSEVRDMIASVDSDENGKLDFNEFLALMTNHYQPHDEQEAQIIESFQMFDRDDNGLIDARELKWVMQNCGDDKMTLEEAQEMIDSADLDGDGCINYHEFAKMLLSGQMQIQHE